MVNSEFDSEECFICNFHSGGNVFSVPYLFPHKLYFHSWFGHFSGPIAGHWFGNLAFLPVLVWLPLASKLCRMVLGGWAPGMSFLHVNDHETSSIEWCTWWQVLNSVQNGAIEFTNNLCGGTLAMSNSMRVFRLEWGSIMQASFHSSIVLFSFSKDTTWASMLGSISDEVNALGSCATAESLYGPLEWRALYDRHKSQVHMANNTQGLITIARDFSVAKLSNDGMVWLWPWLRLLSCDHLLGWSCDALLLWVFCELVYHQDCLPRPASSAKNIYTAATVSLNGVHYFCLCGTYISILPPVTEGSYIAHVHHKSML